MDYFIYKNGELYCEDVPVEEICRQTGTPVFIYSERTIVEHYNRILHAFSEVSPLICYSLKANDNLSICRLLQSQGAGFDVVSGGELFKALKIGQDPKKIVFAGVGKTDSEISFALDNEVLLFNAESEHELEVINEIASQKKTVARIAIRLNPDVDPQTHKHIATGKRITKFGVSADIVENILQRHKQYKNISFLGLHTHIGSQITSVTPYVETIHKVKDTLNIFQKYGVEIKFLDIGGGFGIYYRTKDARPPKEFASAIIPLIKDLKLKLILEPGRFIVGNAGILVTKVLYLKFNSINFIICDAGMNDLIRPVLYDAYHKIWNVYVGGGYSGEVPDEETWQEDVEIFDIVGPICESGDFFARNRKIIRPQRNDLLAIFGAGAYGYSMSSNYNAQPKPPEVLVSGKSWKIIRKRESYDDLIRNDVLE